MFKYLKTEYLGSCWASIVLSYKDIWLNSVIVMFQLLCTLL
jgi:hypothetical protein